MKLLLSGLCSMTLVFFSCHRPADTNSSANQPDPLDISSQDSSVKPQSNFYLFANGTWLRLLKFPLPSHPGAHFQPCLTVL